MYDTVTPSWSVLLLASPLTLWHPSTDHGRPVPEHGCQLTQQWHPSSFDPREPEIVKLCTHFRIYQYLTGDSNSRAFLPPLSLKLEKQQKAMIIVLLIPNAFYIPSSRQNEIFLEEQIYSSCSRELLRRLHGLRERLNISDATHCLLLQPTCRGVTVIPSLILTAALAQSSYETIWSPESDGEERADSCAIPDVPSATSGRGCVWRLPQKKN